MVIHRDHVIDFFNTYAAQYDLSDPKLKLKYDHTFRVAALAEQIARSIARDGVPQERLLAARPEEFIAYKAVNPLSEQDIDLAWLCGMLHDLGRFEQVRRFGSFMDAVTVNHAALSADLLFRETETLYPDENGTPQLTVTKDLIRSFLPAEDADQETLSLIEKAIRLHNVFELPAALTDREYLYATILRDADKIDILRVNVETPVSDIYNLPMEAFLHSGLTPEVLNAALTGCNVDRKYSREAMDFVVGHICLVYGLVYKESYKQVREQGWLKKIIDFPTENKETKKAMGEIETRVNQFIDARLLLRQERHG